MGTVTIHFVGLFLFTGTDAEKRVAVIDADRDNVVYADKPLSRHEAFFVATGVKDQDRVDWPRDGSHYELKGTIQFEAQAGALRASPDRWSLPRIAKGCSELKPIPDEFWDAPRPGATHAIIVIRAGDLCAWRFEVDGKPGAVNTTLTIETGTFAITRGDGKRIEIDPADHPKIRFLNTEPVRTPDERDWCWYYVATGQTCVADPSDADVVAPCAAPPDMNPLSLGCSNSNYP